MRAIKYQSLEIYEAHFNLQLCLTVTYIKNHHGTSQTQYEKVAIVVWNFM